MSTLSTANPKFWIYQFLFVIPNFSIKIKIPYFHEFRIGCWHAMNKILIIIDNQNRDFATHSFEFYIQGGRGFHARYFTDCNTVSTGFAGVIESPNFPDPYPHDRNCTWTIQAPLGNKINASFSHFEIEDPHHR